jgi:hypothetical protein
MVILFLTDLHIGSHCGPAPLDMLPARHSEGSRYLHDILLSARKKLPRKLDYVILGGDLVDGGNRKEDGVGLWFTDSGEQEQAALELLEPFCAKAKRVFRFKGTGYHERWWRGHSNMGRGLGMAARDDGLGVADFDVDGQVLNFAHHPMGGSTLYVGTAMERETVWSSVAAAARKVVQPRWVVRGHRHCFGATITETGTSVLLPCFELVTWYAQVKSHWRFQPSLGLVTMRPTDMSPDGSGYVFTPDLYPLPREEAIGL